MAHRVGLGMHNHGSGAFIAAMDALQQTGAGADWTTPWMNVSFLYHISELFSLDINAGFMLTHESYPGGEEGWNAFEMALGPRALFTLATHDRTRVYTGIGLAILVGYNSHYDDDDTDDGGCEGECDGTEMFGFALTAPIGIEYRFRSAPHLALSLEVNFHLVYENTGGRVFDGDDIQSEDLAHRLLFGLGNPRVIRADDPGAPGLSFFDFLSFLTIGLHYML